MKRLLEYFVLVLSIVGTFLFAVYSVSYVRAEDTYPYKGMIVSGTLVVHDKANTSSSSSVTEIAFGTIVDVLEATANNTYKITYKILKPNSISRYVVDFPHEVSNDSE